MFTLASGTTSHASLEVKRSTFLSTIARINSEEEARQVISDQRSKYPDARHHCSAFIISSPSGPDRMSSNDDGEPSGTAGAPILNVLSCANLTNVVAVVTRYFGGTLLGTGGLVRAYSSATSTALASADIVEIKDLERLQIRLGLTDLGRVEAALRGHNWSILNVTWAEPATIELALPSSELSKAQDLVASLTRGTGEATVLNPIQTEVRTLLDI